VSDEIRYADIGPDERAMDWRITTHILSDKVLMKTLEESQSGGEKHAVVALVQGGELQEAYVSPEGAVKKSFPFNAVDQAFAAYKVGRGVCILLVRDHKAVISINGVR
jgi:hypothetical protein